MKTKNSYGSMTTNLHQECIFMLNKKLFIKYSTTALTNNNSLSLPFLSFGYNISGL